MIVVVAGLRRSGTSLIAQLLHEMGVVMYEETAPDNGNWNPNGFYEDVAFINVIDRMMKNSQFKDGRIVKVGDPAALEDFKKLIAERKSKYRNWGTKNFAVNYMMAEFVHWCNQPVHLIAARRTFAEAVTSFVARSGHNFQSAIANTAHDLYNLDMTYRTHAGPKMEVSFAQLLAEPVLVTAQLSEFCGVPFLPQCADIVNPQCKRF